MHTLWNDHIRVYLSKKIFGRQRIRQNDKRQAKQLCGIALLKINTDTQNGQSITCQVEGGDYLGEMSRMPSLRKVKRKICRYCKKKKKASLGMSANILSTQHCEVTTCRYTGGKEKLGKMARNVAAWVD